MYCITVVIEIIMAVVYNILFTHVFIIIYSLQFFTSTLADGLSLEIEWEQVSSGLQDSSQYSGRLQ